MNLCPLLACHAQSHVFCTLGDRVFLDVDDLEEIGNLENYVRATGVMLFFLSRRYFTSKNCLCEIKTSLELDKPCAVSSVEL